MRYFADGITVSEIKNAEPEVKREWHVPVFCNGGGYVKVLARSKNEAEAVINNMSKKRLLTYYKENYMFIKTGEAELPDGN